MVMNKDINLVVKCFIKEFVFSFDEVILEIKQAVENDGARGIAHLVFAWIETLLCKHYEILILPKLAAPCCDHSYWLIHGNYQRSINTSIGKLKLNLHRMKCHNCQQTFLPFRIFFNLPKHQTHSYELTKKCLEELKDQSYRRSTTHFKNVDIQLTKSGLHRMVLGSDFIKQDLKIKDDLEVIAADGTGYKPHSELQKQELKVVIGMTKDQRLVPIGCWIRSSWYQLAKEIKKANHDKKILFKPIANILLSDGDIHLIAALRSLAYHEQRCIWHVARDFKYVYRYQDKGDRELEKELTQKIWDLVLNPIKYKPESSNPTLEEKLILMREVWLAEKELAILEENLKEKNYTCASTYLHNARMQLFTHLRMLLASGTEVPKVTSRIERFMREMARRLKRIAHNWSEKGAEAMARILMKLTLDKEGWEEYWKNKMKISGNFKMEVSLAI